VKMKKVRDMLRIISLESGVFSIDRRHGVLSTKTRAEIKEKLALLRMLDDHSKIKGVGHKFADGIFYIDITGEDDAA